MSNCFFRCHKCKTFYPIGLQNTCKNCGGILIVGYSDVFLKKARKKLKCKAKNGMWAYRASLPPISDENIVTFQEGCTRLIPSISIGVKLGLSKLYFKDETSNPTGSFKDRSISVCVSMAKEFSCQGIVISSSGNGAAAAAAYGTKGGMDTIIFIPENTPAGKVSQALAYGGTVVKVKGNFSKSYHAAVDTARKERYMNVTTTFLNPFGLEGYKFISYEIFEQLKIVPDYIIIPVGDGPILYGIYKGFDELRRMGLLRKIPKLVCVQAKGCAPISEAWMENRKVTSCKTPKTVATAISDPLIGYEQDGDITIEAIRAANGYGVVVEDADILAAGRELAKEEGIFAEPSSAVALAGLRELINRNILRKDDSCVCLLTGHGLKDPGAYVGEDVDIPIIDTNYKKEDE